MKSKAAEQRRIARHIANLDSPDEKVSAQAEGYLIRYYGARALVPLLDVCGHSNPTVRFRAAWVLGYTKDPRAYDTILRMTDDPDEGVRYDATIALGILGDMRAVEPLTRLLLANDETRPAGMAFRKMGLQVVPVMAELLRNGNAEVRAAASWLLGHFARDFSDERCIQLLMGCRNDGDPTVREETRFWLEEIGRAAHEQPCEAMHRQGSFCTLPD